MVRESELSKKSKERVIGLILIVAAGSGLWMFIHLTKPATAPSTHYEVRDGHVLLASVHPGSEATLVLALGVLEDVLCD
jgi:hypothetical protein